MAEQDASVAIQNALQKLDQHPNLPHNGEEKLNSVKSKLRKLRRYGSRLDKLNYTVTELTQVREFANDVEDAMDDAFMISSAADAAQKRWRLLSNFFLFFSQPNGISQQQVEEQIEEIHNRTTSLGRFICGGDGDDDKEEEEIVAEDQDLSQIPAQKDLFYLSLSGFPADVEISARRLIQIWMAEKFRDSQGNVLKESQGRRQVDRLLDKGYITQVERGTCGTLKTFKIGKGKLDVCKSAAEKENFLHVKIINPGRTADFSTLDTARLAIHNESTSDLFTGCDQRAFAHLSKVRSLHFHCVSSNDVNKTGSDFGFLRPQKKVHRSLRVLDLGCLVLEVVPEVIGKLAHLRYLRLTASKGTKIPSSICALPNLQTIDLKETKSVKTLPVEIWKMKKNLQYLHLGGATALPPPRRANHYVALENLQTFCGIRPDKELKRLMVRAKFPNIKRLSLQKKNKDLPDEFLSVLNSLDHLYHLRSLTVRGSIKELPSDWNAFPSSLTKMTLSKTLIPADKCVKTLQNLPSLKFLKLMEESVSGTTMECDGGGFPALQVLRMVEIKKLSCWRVKEGGMRLLRDLEVKDCEGLKRGRVEVFKPLKELIETLLKLKEEYPEMIVEVDSLPILEPQQQTSTRSNSVESTSVE